MYTSFRYCRILIEQEAEATGGFWQLTSFASACGERDDEIDPFRVGYVIVGS
jgi:hypothetical protein